MRVIEEKKKTGKIYGDILSNFTCQVLISKDTVSWEKYSDENNSLILFAWYPWSDTTKTATEQLCYIPARFWLTPFLLINGSLWLIKTEGMSDLGGWQVQDGCCCILHKRSLYKVKTPSVIQDDHECLWYFILYGLGGNVTEFSLEMLILFTWFLSYSFSIFQRAEGIQDESKSSQNSAHFFLSNRHVYVILESFPPL